MLVQPIEREGAQWKYIASKPGTIWAICFAGIRRDHESRIPGKRSVLSQLKEGLTSKHA